MGGEEVGDVFAFGRVCGEVYGPAATEGCMMAGRGGASSVWGGGGVDIEGGFGAGRRRCLCRG